jgi:hypothetical protein
MSECPKVKSKKRVRKVSRKVASDKLLRWSGKALDLRAQITALVNKWVHESGPNYRWETNDVVDFIECNFRHVDLRKPQ